MESALILTRQACNEIPGSYIFFKTYNNPFMFSDHPMINAIGVRCEELNAGHSGASFAICLRQVQKEIRSDILNGNPNNYKTVE